MHKILFFVVVLLYILGAIFFSGKKSENLPLVSVPTPTPTPYGMYIPPRIPNKSSYTIVLVGDSMTHALGPHGGTFSEYINVLYKNNNKAILIDNYAAGGNNILSLPDMMNKTTTYWDATFEPLLSRAFDLIIVESFGYNPLSQFPIEEGLAIQAKALNDLMVTISTIHPESAVIFVATIAPSKTHYAKKVNPNSTLEERQMQALERIAYIQNHIAYASAHNIPLINIFEKSLNTQGDGNLIYINPDDYIHPSFAGVDFIGHEIANFIYNSNIFPVNESEENN